MRQKQNETFRLVASWRKNEFSNKEFSSVNPFFLTLYVSLEIDEQSRAKRSVRSMFSFHSDGSYFIGWISRGALPERNVIVEKSCSAEKQMVRLAHR